MSRLPDHATRMHPKSPELPVLLVAHANHVLPDPKAKVSLYLHRGEYAYFHACTKQHFKATTMLPLLLVRDNKHNKVVRLEPAAAQGEPTEDQGEVPVVRLVLLPLPPRKEVLPPLPDKDAHVPPDQRVSVLPELHPPTLCLLPISPSA